MPQSLIVTIIAAALAGLAVAELLSLLQDDRHLSIFCEADMELAEPGELVTLRYWVRNTGRWPLPFVHISFLLDERVEIREDENWRRANRISGAFGDLYCFRTGLLPHRALQGRLRFSYRERGVYSLGRVYVETVDFLGLRSKVRSLPIPGEIVCTARLLEDDPALEPLGGFLGDVSARRFILDDPSLVLGFRDYTGAEPMKQISWTQTARTGRLTVKKHDFTVDVDVTVLVDQSACDEAVAERCLSLVRTVCDRLELARIPYALRSNGDLFETKKGGGRTHSFEIQRRIGRSHFVRYRRLEELVEQRAEAGLGSRGWIVITPRVNAAMESVLKGLRAASDVQLCLLTGEEAMDRA